MTEFLFWLICGFLVILNWMYAPLIWDMNCGNSVAMFFVNIAITFSYLGAMIFRVIQLLYSLASER